MILADTSIWVDHLRRGDARLEELLTRAEVVAHPFVIGELALGVLRQRDIILTALRRLPCTQVASDAEVLEFIERHSLFGAGIGYVDAHLLAATRLTLDTRLWTRDKRLATAARRMALAVHF